MAQLSLSAALWLFPNLRSRLLAKSLAIAGRLAGISLSRYGVREIGIGRCPKRANGSERDFASLWLHFYGRAFLVRLQRFVDNMGRFSELHRPSLTDEPSHQAEESFRKNSLPPGASVYF